MRHMASMSNSDVTWTSWRLKWPTTRLFVQQFTQTNIKRNIKGPRPWSFVRGNHWSPVNSHYKGPSTRKTFPCDDVIIDEWVSVLVLSSWSITVTLNERHAVSNHPPIDCLSNSLLKLTAKKTYFVRFIDDQWIYITRGDEMWTVFPWHTSSWKIVWLYVVQVHTLMPEHQAASHGIECSMYWPGFCSVFTVRHRKNKWNQVNNCIFYERIRKHGTCLWVDDIQELDDQGKCVQHHVINIQI